MKRKMLALLTGSMLISSVGFAAPITESMTGETTVGYNHYNMSYGHNNNADNDSVYLENAVSDKFTLGVEHNSNTDDYNATWNTTDIYAQYKVDQNVRLIVGNRNYDYGIQTNRMFYGIGVTENLGPKLDGYASVIGNDYTSEWQAGVNYALSDKTAINVNYKSNKDDYYPTYEGLGIGINCKF